MNRIWYGIHLSGTALAVAWGSSTGCLARGADEIPALPVPKYAAFSELSPSAIEPAGWLRLYLEKQARGLGGHLPEISEPFNGSYWSDNATPPSKHGWWPWEQKGYWIDGMMRCALALRDPTALAAPKGALNYTFGNIASDGYIGPEFLHHFELTTRDASYFRWPHTVFFRAAMAYADATGEKSISEALHRHYLVDAEQGYYGSSGRNITNVEVMLWTYARTKDPALLELAEKSWREFLLSTHEGESVSADLSPKRVMAITPINGHGVSYAEKSKIPAILFSYTGKPEYLRYALAAQERVFKHHGLVDGVPSASENYRGKTPLDAHETCDIADHTWTWGYLLMATGEGIWADRIEEAVFNAGMGAIGKEWKGCQYFSGPNQVIATLDSSHVPYVEESKSWMAYGPNPGHHVACCAANVHRFLPNYALRQWMATPDHGVAAVLFGASTVRAKVGVEQVAVKIVEDTGYPFDGGIRFTVQAERKVQFPLLLRIPAWCAAPSITLNGQPFALPPVEKGFVRIDRVFAPGDTLALSLPAKPERIAWGKDGVAFRRGPLVFSLAVKESGRTTVTEKYSTREFPEWEATPASDWNFGIDADAAEIGFQEEPSAGIDPWMNPPMRLMIAARKIPGWELARSLQHPERFQTPPFPDLNRLAVSPRSEAISLVPLGTTQLRITIFPVISNR